MWVILSVIIAPAHLHAAENIQKVSETLDLAICLEQQIPLYNQEEEIVAYYYPGAESGYLIVDAETWKPIEYSYNNKLSFFSNSERKYYYGGPFCYYFEVGNQLKGRDGSLIEKSDLHFDNKAEDFSVSDFAKTTSRATQNIRISHVPRNYTYNPNGICGSTAAAIFLMYYDDYVSDKYVDTAYEVSGTGEKIIKMLVPYIDGSSLGSTAADMVKGLNNYLSKKGFSKSAKQLSQSRIAEPLSSDRPVLIDLDRHPTYGEHWVVGYGYNTYREGSSTIRMYVVVNGWGDSAAYVDESYCGRGVRI